MGGVAGGSESRSADSAAVEGRMTVDRLRIAVYGVMERNVGAVECVRSISLGCTEGDGKGIQRRVNECDFRVRYCFW